MWDQSIEKLIEEVEKRPARGRTQLVNDCWNNYRDVCALNAVVLGDMDNYRPTIVERKIACVR
jgi:hypothetical protein